MTVSSEAPVHANGNGEKAGLSVVLHPNDAPAVPGLLKQISSRGQAALAPRADDAARLALLESARGLVAALEKPRETMIRHCWAENSLFAVLSLGIEAGVWAYLSIDDQPKTVAATADATGMEEALLARLLKHVAAMGYLVETGPDEYRPTNFIRSLTIPIIAAGYPVFTGAGNSGGLGRCVLALPSHLQKTNYTTPKSMADGNLQYAHDTKLNMFEWLQANERGMAFNQHMGALLVDIGGGLGHDLEAFHDRFPTAPGRLVLQDLEPVISAIPADSLLSPRIERAIHDFHTPQPVQGARAYYLHSVLHDWPDEVCCSILARVRAAMRPGYSRLLVNENVIPDTAAQWEATALDVLMLALLSSKERTRAEWVRLLEDNAGLKVSGIYTFANGVESLIELKFGSVGIEQDRAEFFSLLLG
ncbi:S-adenosyl-L-methionine-dependent methyltransferase [Parathielavia hyrcaniae]|uniref:S-adenosyl-L-methionine-dependent methyltransferase n=1 Tax=Parathielavia hyrcaniae TaxID=113614 RepID=A0AAN6PWJ9_9PEZI|nr:S-adenosyl-L-methionine-dependent methyltransferase [Parathielavia hyrcaniae]